MFRQLSRFVHSTATLASSTKTDLAKLRKKTGYTFANCKKALELNGYDVSKVGTPGLFLGLSHRAVSQ